MTDPSAEYAGHPRLLALLVTGVTGVTVWSVARLAAALPGNDAGPATWLLAAMLLWWLPLSWCERRITAPPGERAGLDALRVTVQVPVYNEDPEALRACLRSVLAQSRPVTRVRVVDDGSHVPYDDVRHAFESAAAARGVETTWDRTPNRGKRHAQMHALAEDDGDVFVTLDSDSVLDRHAVREGLAPFADPRVQSVAGQVLVLNRTAGPIGRLTGLLYLPFTLGLRSAGSVLRKVTLNSGALAFYRAGVVRRCAGAYENERFRGRPMQMNDDSLLTFHALLAGRTVHQPSAMVFTLAPARFGHYARQQVRWMRGTAVRHLWWLRYLPLTSVVFWTTVAQHLHLLLMAALPVALLTDRQVDWGAVAAAGAQAGLAMNYVMALRLFTVRRGDESAGARLLAFALAPLAALWRLVVLRPLLAYAVLTCHRVGRWGTRGGVEVGLTAGK
ncbi:glycosyltransferase family 2 protein [Nonomuraea sp. NPDC049504]|uniref:glycosyltransferase family 2 protein n=1 Tax=Nonomuraea sp. NPDC049504 TaxID=3154729 RepID=UPI003429651D